MFSPRSRILRGALLALALMTAGPVADAVAAPALKVPAAASVSAAATELGASHWGRQACGGQVAITWEHLGTRTNAESRWASAAGGAPSTYLRCTIAFSLDVHWDWPKLCTITEHELGHLNGHAHVDDDADLMSAYYFDATPECEQAPVPSGSTVAAAAKTPSRSSVAQTRKARDRARRAR